MAHQSRIHAIQAWELQVQSLGWEVPLEEEMTTQSSILAWEIPWTEELGQTIAHRVAKSVCSDTRAHTHKLPLHNGRDLVVLFPTTALPKLREGLI